MNNDQILEGLERAYEIICSVDKHPCYLLMVKSLEAVKAMLTPKAVVGRHTHCCCPTCGRRIRSGLGSSSRVRDIRCQDCGQVIDWSELDKQKKQDWERRLNNHE